MRVHEARCATVPTLAANHPAGAQREVLEVDVVPEDRTVVDAVPRQVVDLICVVVARTAAHVPRLPGLPAAFVADQKGV
jgi:hypothetical protein